MTRIRILAYHAVRNTPAGSAANLFTISPQVLREHIRVLRRARFNFITGGQLADAFAGTGDLPPRPLLMTFDDGYADLVHTTGPILAEFGVPAVAFIVTDLIGQQSSWDTTTVDSVHPLCTAEELGEVRRFAIEIGAHSCTHRRLTRLSDDEIVREVVGSRDKLGALGLGVPQLFAFPYGDHDARIRDAVRSAGYSAALTTYAGRARLTDDRFQVPRLLVLNHHRGARFRALVELSGCINDMRASRAGRTLSAARARLLPRSRTAIRMRTP